MAGRPLVPWDHILQIGFGFWSSKTLLSAVELGLTTLLAKRQLDGESLGGQIETASAKCARLFDALVALQLLKRNGTRYANTPETALFLDRAKPTYVGGMLEM